MNIIITGSSSGIGRALAERLLESGNTVCGIARSDQSTLPMAKSRSYHALRCDVANWGDIESAANKVASIWDHADGLITCAGLQGEIGPLITADPIRWSATVHSNIDGTYYAIRAFYELLARTPRRAKVICFSGGGATKARPYFSAYGIAKTAVVRLVETAAAELNGRAIDLNAVAPGAIYTRLTEEVITLGPSVVGADEYESAKKLKAHDSSSMQNALALVEWLLSPSSDGISGRLLSAPWDGWRTLDRWAGELASTDIYTLRRITPKERNRNW